MTISLSTVLAAFAFQAAGSLNVSDTARVYVHDADAGDTTMVDVESTPRLALGLDWRRAELDVEYAPHLLWADVGGPTATTVLFLHDAVLQLAWSGRRYRLTLSQSVSIGDQSFARLRAVQAPGEESETIDASAVPDGASTPPALELLPSVSIVRVAAEETRASVHYEHSHRVSSDLRSSFAIAGGADAQAQAQAILPQQRTARVDATVDYRASPRDTLGTDLGLARITTSNDFDHWLGTALERWSRSFSPQSGAWLGAGLSVFDSTGPMGRSSTEAGPIATASVFEAGAVHRMPTRVQLDVGYRPEVNALVGTLQQRLFASAQGSVRVGRSSVQLALGAAQSFPRDAPDAARSVSGDLAIEQELLDWLSAELGGQLVWQRLGPADARGAAVTSRYSIYAGLEGRLPELRF